MAGALVQFRIDEDVRDEAMQVCEELGLSLQEVLRMCSRRLANDRAPYLMHMISYGANPYVKMLREASARADELGVSDMTLEEINAEIAAVRAENRARQQAVSRRPIIMR